MNPVMYLISNPHIPMTKGKFGAQAAHAAVEAFRITEDNNTKRMWDCGGHYSKVVLESDDLAAAERYINDRGFKTVLIIDEGRTEFETDLTPTFIGVEILDKDNSHVKATFSAFKLFGHVKLITPPIQFSNFCYNDVSPSGETMKQPHFKRVKELLRGTAVRQRTGKTRGS